MKTQRLDRSAFGNVVVWHVTVTNSSTTPIGNIKYRTAYYAETGVKVGSGGVDAASGGEPIYRRIEPHSTRTLEINDGVANFQAVTGHIEFIDCQIIAGPAQAPAGAPNDPPQSARDHLAKTLNRPGRIAAHAEGRTLVIEDTDPAASSTFSMEDLVSTYEEGFMSKENRAELRKFGFTRVRLKRDNESFDWTIK